MSCKKEAEILIFMNNKLESFEKYRDECYERFKQKYKGVSQKGVKTSAHKYYWFIVKMFVDKGFHEKRVYSFLRSLEEKGLVEKNINRISDLNRVLKEPSDKDEMWLKIEIGKNEKTLRRFFKKEYRKEVRKHNIPDFYYITSKGRRFAEVLKEFGF